MSGTNKDDRLRLVPLVKMLAKAEKPQHGLSEIFDLAFRGKIRLYRRVPADNVVYVDLLMPIITHRRSSMFPRDMGYFNRYSPKYDQIHPEIKYVALDPDHADELKAGSRVSSDTAFASGLMEHPDHVLAQLGWLVPCQFSTALVVCPTVPDVEIEERRRLVRHVLLTTTPEDVYVDERILAAPTDPQAPPDNDPYSLCRRAPGVYALHCIARHYHSAIKADRTKFAQVQKLLISLLSKLGETRAKQIAKLINPHHKRNSGVPEKHQKHFDVKLLDSEQFKSRYRKESFVTDALALILYVTECWLDSRAKQAAGAATTHADRSTVNQHFGRLGFYAKEQDALTELLLLPSVTSRSQAWRKIKSTNNEL